MTPAPPPRRDPARPSPAAEWGLLAATLVAAAGLCRMASGGIGGHAVVPLLVLAVVGFGVPTLLFRTRLAPALVAVAGTVAVVLVALEIAVVRATPSWYPTGGALRVLATDVRDARAQLASFHLPLHAGPGLVLLGAAVAGIAGLSCRLLLGPPGARPHPGLALLPALALVTWSCVARPGTGAVVLAAAAAAAATPALAGLASGRSDRGRGAAGTGAARQRRRLAAAAVLVGLLAMAGAVGIGIPLGTASAGGGGPAAAAPTTLSLVTGLVRVERDDADLVLFRARSTVPTYWQVGVLTVWRGGRDQWVPGPGTAAVLRGGTAAPAVLPATAARRFTTSVTIANLSSRLLPVPPSTVEVTGAPGAVLTAAGVLTPSASRPHESYTATALETPAATPGESGPGGDSATGNATGPGSLTTAQLAPYLALPAIPATVADLARQVTAAATSPLAQAEELVNWFRSGRFRYTLTPPAAPAGTDPLVDFLTAGRAGSCESFAGAFAVMARSLGLPTRVAIGFTGGRPAAGGGTVVRGADAHAWPEVYLGATLGWVSFEPTPERPAGEVAPADVVGQTTAPPTAPPPPPTNPTGPPPATATTVPTTVPATVPTTPTTTPATAPAAPVATAGGSGDGWWVPVVVVLAVALLLLAAAGLLASRGRRRRRAAPPDQRVVAAYRRTERALRRAGIGRPASWTPATHARGLLVATTRSTWSLASPGEDELLAALRDLRDLALLVEQAGYSPHPVTPGQAATAEAAATRIRQALRRPAVRAPARSLPTLPSVPHADVGTRAPR